MPNDKGPDETNHGEEAVEDANRRMTGGDDAGKSEKSDDVDDLRGPDGTPIDKKAAKEAERRMTGDS